ncbi:MAG: (4Fe-4S)-binding protein [Chitinophagaceae bacterium]|nr:(4Fe-4S)-binding protein [Chitinophagaceae bacterium]
MSQKTFKYTNGEVTVLWKPEVCIHSAVCIKGLPGVFNVQRKPWIDMSLSDTKGIVEQVRKCPSGALSYVMNEQPNNEGPQATTEKIIAGQANIIEIQVSENGPYLIKTECLIQHSDGREEKKSGTVALCRCGSSQNKPYCDGSHKKTGFEG